jgi:hypothetical protein
MSWESFPFRGAGSIQCRFKIIQNGGFELQANAAGGSKFSVGESP